MSNERTDSAPQPRLTPLQAGQFTDEMRQFLLRSLAHHSTPDADARKDAAGYRATASDLEHGDPAQLLAKMPGILSTMLQHPALFTALMEVGYTLTREGMLLPRERELAILRIGWLCQAANVWGEHVFVAKQIGISRQDIERVTKGSHAPGWSEHEQALVRATEELYDNAMISDATWEILSRRLNNRQLIELPVLVGQYQAAAYYQNSLRISLVDGNVGLAAR